MIVLSLPADTSEAVIQQVARAAKRFPGSEWLEVRVPTGRGLRRLTFGLRYEASEACLAALREFGRVEVVDG